MSLQLNHKLPSGNCDKCPLSKGINTGATSPPVLHSEQPLYHFRPTRAHTTIIIQVSFVNMKTFFALTAALVSVAIVPAASTNRNDAFTNSLLSNNPAAHPNCYWDGTAVFCAGSCPKGYSEEDRNSCGDGACSWTGYKSLCCKNTD
ncbi:hypothetical protein CPB84DRAFT_1841081 [Gymnopilus junonius]|uniref:Uncharacterized protein n=1 Tax=Gymnopilus junonius TaxID=109634 RepID=A0A9P5TU73_GYMJU|nr:hypothetical protein CPB84DRAFT_1841081 [Gymnopilus junonius]